MFEGFEQKRTVMTQRSDHQLGSRRQRACGLAATRLLANAHHMASGSSYPRRTVYRDLPGPTWARRQLQAEQEAVALARLGQLLVGGRHHGDHRCYRYLGRLRAGPESIKLLAY